MDNLEEDNYVLEYVYLYEPDGTLNAEVSLNYAITYCMVHPGWTWAQKT